MPKQKPARPLAQAISQSNGSEVQQKAFEIETGW